ncbi:hypothetical protein HF1_05540 [Mycoplasma haemofelis str. Langford 1]|uniref:Uncharacterized protein n=1 Tax=Mycoplasma haemofelis (strain Langford 1) TaxID=941640 RepID=E8ZHE1_MYCHL|nr:hypothetical protein [Mycoplasma haemofelis]CBY92562.1 hypothetical protein HF1_05540 [Mycoplasma haemofelis str. Langford 1]
MSSLSFKAATAAVGASGAGLGGYGIYHLSSSPKETIRDRITSSLKDKKKRFLGKEDSAWRELESKYTKLSNKPKKANGTTDLSFSEIPSWCDKSASEEYSDSNKDLYDQVLTFCFFNTNTLLSNTDSGVLKSNQDKSHEEWKAAWDSYQKTADKESKGLKITETSVNTDINGSERNKGGEALHKWCTETSAKKMYDSEDLFPLFKHWCVK